MRSIGKRVAIVATDGVACVELLTPLDLLHRQGAAVEVIAPTAGPLQTWVDDAWGPEVPVDRALTRARSDDYDALVLPGGVLNADRLRADPDVRAFVRAFFAEDKAVGVICHAPWALIDAGVVKGRRLTSWPSLRLDLVNAGARWEDAEVVVDGKLVSTRRPGDLEAFCEVLADVVAQAPLPVA